MTDLQIWANQPGEESRRIDAPPTLGAGESRLIDTSFTVPVANQPGTIVIKATGTTSGTHITAMASVEQLATADKVTVSLHGSERLTEYSDADLIATVANDSNRTVEVLVGATAGRYGTRLSTTFDGLSKASSRPHPTLKVTLPPQDAVNVFLRVGHDASVRSGQTAVVVTASAPQAVTGTAAHDLQLASSVSGLLPDPLGSIAALLLPGITILGTCTLFYWNDRRAIGIASNPFGLVWENKWAALAAGIAAIAFDSLFGWAIGVNYFDSYRWHELGVAIIAGFGSTAVICMVWFAGRRLLVPLVNSSSSPRSVVSAARRFDDDVQRPVYELDGKPMVLVHRDGSAYVLTPPLVHSDFEATKHADDLNVLGPVASFADHRRPKADVAPTATNDRMKLVDYHEVEAKE